MSVEGRVARDPHTPAGTHVRPVTPNDRSPQPNINTPLVFAPGTPPINTPAMSPAESPREGAATPPMTPLPGAFSPLASPKGSENSGKPLISDPPPEQKRPSVVSSKGIGPRPPVHPTMNAQAWKESHRRQANQYRAKALHYMELENLTLGDTEMTRRDILREIVTKQRKNKNGCLVLPLNLAFFVLYALAIFLHEDITNVWLLESAVRDKVVGGIENVETIGDVWAWMKSDMLDMFFNQQCSYCSPAEDLPEKDWSRVLLYNQVQGSVILEQFRENDHAWGKSYTGPLYSHLAPIQQANTGFISKSDSPSSTRRLERQLSMMDAEWMSYYCCSAPTDDQTFQFFLYPTVTKQTVLQQLQYLEQRQWLDERTNTLKVIVLLVNGEMGRPRLEQATIELQFSRGGGIYTKVGVEAIMLQLFPPGSSGLMNMGVDFLWLMMLIGSSGWCVYEFWTAFIASKLKEHVTGIILTEWLILMMGWVNVGGLMLQTLGADKVAKSIEEQRDYVNSMNTSAMLPTDAVEESHSLRLHKDTNAQISVLGNTRLFSQWMTLILIFRFFSSFRVQPRLAVVTRTLKATMLDLGHFLVVFFPTFIAYAISGNILFGRRIEIFSTVRGSVGICLRIAFENEFEWLSLSEEYYWTCAVWCWSFLIMVVMIMLNMCVAIVLDIYNEVRATTNSSDTIFLFMSQVASYMGNMKRWVKDKEMLCLFGEGIDDTATISPEDLLEALPNMTTSQKDMLLKACKFEMLWQAKQDLVAGNFLKLGASIKLSIDDAAQQITQLNQELCQAEKAQEEVAQPSLQDGSGVNTPNQAVSPVSPAASPATTPRRMVGVSRPFPGMPATPGGYFPPVCIPTADQTSVCHPATLRQRSEDEPVWFVELRDKMRHSGDLMDSILTDLQYLHWQWHQIDRRVTTIAYGDNKRRQSVSSADQLKLAGGHPIL